MEAIQQSHIVTYMQGLLRGYIISDYIGLCVQDHKCFLVQWEIVPHQEVKEREMALSSRSTDLATTVTTIESNSS
jgi:hypothetical protein